MTSRGTEGSWGIVELLAGVLLGSLTAAAAVVWLVGGFAGLLSGASWVHTPPDVLPRVVMALPAHLDDPRLAWPSSQRAELPGVGGFMFAAAFATAGLGLAGLATGRAVEAARRSDRAGARWGRRRELKDLRVRRPKAGRLALGRQGRALIAAEPRQSVIVVAPTQSGKTTGLAVPALLEWQGPVIATSVKTDLVRDTIALRRTLGDVRVFDPAGATDFERAHWTPLAGCERWQGARETAARLCAVANPGRGMTDTDFWTSAAARYLAPLLHAAAIGGWAMTDVVRWIDTEEGDQPRQALAGMAFSEDSGERSAAKAALAALDQVREADERLRSSLGATAGVALDAYGDPTVAESSWRADISADWLLGGTNTAYLCATATAQERLRPLFVTLIDQIVAHVYDLAAQTGAPIDPPLLLVLDEAANIAPLPRLDQLAATGAGQGLQLVTVVQDLAQLEGRWGRKSDTILNNHRAKVFGPGISCEKTLQYLTRVLGDEAIPQRSVTRAESGRRSTTEATTYRALSSADRTRQVRPGSALLIYGHLPPAHISLRPWYADRALRRLVSTEAHR